MAQRPPEHTASRVAGTLARAVAVVPAASFAWFAFLAASTSHALVVPLRWVPSLGVDLTLVIDGLAMQFLLLITGIGTVVFVYGASYMAGRPEVWRMFAHLVLFLAARCSSSGSWRASRRSCWWDSSTVYAPARRSAQQALVTPMTGGVALLVGVVLLGEIGGTYSLRTLVATAPALAHDGRLAFALGCIFVGAFAKSAQWPFHFWLPNAMAAPTPVSAYLHSATMVKLGIYLLARLTPASLLAKRLGVTGR